MFGFLRFYLALLVVVTHISTMLGHAGGFAVYSFYTLSGYLMTYIMNENYGYNFAGFKKYALNRFLRIYPAYWAVCIVTLVSIYNLPSQFYEIHESLRFPSGWYEIVSNISILGLFPNSIDGGTEQMARLVPAAWALHVELIFYILIGLFLGKHRFLVVAWLILSVLYTIVAIKYKLPRYAPFYAASLPFSLGAFLYHYRGTLLAFKPDSILLTQLLLVFYVVYAATAGLIPITTSVYPFYFNIVLTAVLILLLSDTRTDIRWIRNLDRFFGDLSYPIYLSHWLVASLVGIYFGLELSLSLFIITIPFLLLFSIIIKMLIDDPVEKVRRKIAPR